ncbi:MAG: DNA polymerase/3'-5' exonuclease PolX [Chloroflexi bacterium]|nr:DNA polymerase/3'-5' exonuclease PolX [Chloroflexota bacterium]MCC6895568.1 DNA polymerase/3'-5' exonuclease PolX [Anaerolineae bacterium]
MSLTNREIADTFERVATLLEIKGEIIHRVLSYRRAGETIRELPRDLHAISAEGTLTDLPNIGDTLAAKINEMLETGKLQFYEKLAAEIPPGLVDIVNVNGVGPKKAKLFWKELNITTIPELETAAREGKLRVLAGMGEKSELKIIEGIESLGRQTGRAPLGVALPAAQAILDRLLAIPGAIEGTIAGSIRRARPTIGDVDLLVASDNAAPIMDAFVAMEQVARILGHGPTKSSVELLNGLQVDLRVLEKARWGTAINYFTGSQAHNIRMREIALKKGYSLNEHAFSPVDKEGNIIEDAPKILCATEEEVYTTVGLPWIPPELREDNGEIEAAQAGKLPKLITIDDMQADLHMHTTASDGTRSIREMAEEARQRGRKYIVITDHSHSLGIANGLSIERLLAQQEDVRKVDAELGGSIRVFHGTEMDMNADGGLDFPDDVLEKLDFVIASLHVSLRQPRDQVTKRMLNAINNPHVDLIGHPRAQYIPDREPADLDMDAIFEAAKANGTALEINANPRRLDLEAQFARRAVEMGIPLSINTDAHSPDHMDLMIYGVMTARRGWVTAESVINTWPVDRFISWTQNRGR